MTRGRAPQDPERPLGGLGGNSKDSRLAELIEHHQEFGPWPLELPLPLPRWKDAQVKPYRVDSLREFEALASEIEMHLRKVLEEHNYDTVGNFFDFYDSYQDSGCDNVMDFLRT